MGDCFRLMDDQMASRYLCRLLGRKRPGGVLDISPGGEVRRGPSYPDPV